MSDSTLPESSRQSLRAVIDPPQSLVLVVAWSHDEPARIGEMAVLPPGEPGPWRVLGRGEAQTGNPHPRLQLSRVRPGHSSSTGPLASLRVSRVQLLLRAHGTERIEFENVGRCRLFVDQKPARSGSVRPGQQLQLGAQFLLSCSVRPAWLRELKGFPEFEFGLPDPSGMVGESFEAWEIRRQLVHAAHESAHVLITGTSGTGKELAARCVHALSARNARPMVSRSAATFPEGLIDAELFGNVRNYPHPNMPDRPGLIGQAHGSTLLLDEIGELPASLQGHLLRVLDGGEYQRLGESTTRRADVRVIAATNRELSSLKHDLLARFKIRVHLPDLDARRDDIPLLARHLLEQLKGHGTGGDESDARAAPRGSLSLERVASLLQHRYQNNVRELEMLIRESVVSRVPPGRSSIPAALLPVAGEHGKEELSGGVDPASITAEQIRAALLQHRGVQERVWRALGLSSRHALGRLLRKYGIRP